MADLALVKTLNPQEIWRKEKFNTYLPTGNASPTADPDMDKQVNLYEYATGGDPNVMNPSPVSAVAHTGTTYSINYLRNPAATDTTLTFERNTNLTVNAWDPVAPTSDTVISTTAGIELRVAQMDVGSNTNDNFRIRVTETP